MKTYARARRVKIGTTVDPSLIRAVDDYIAAHPGTDRSAVIDEALRLWYERRQEAAMEAQFLAPTSARERAERESWRAIRRAAAKRRFGRRRR